MRIEIPPAASFGRRSPTRHAVCRASIAWTAVRMRGERLGGREAVVRGLDDLRGELVEEAGDADHEELVEVRLADREELEPLEERPALVVGLLEDALVEGEPGELAVQEGKRRRGRGRGGPAEAAAASSWTSLSGRLFLGLSSSRRIMAGRSGGSEDTPPERRGLRRLRVRYLPLWESFRVAPLRLVLGPEEVEDRLDRARTSASGTSTKTVSQRAIAPFQSPGLSSARSGPPLVGFPGDEDRALVHETGEVEGLPGRIPEGAREVHGVEVGRRAFQIAAWAGSVRSTCADSTICEALPARTRHPERPAARFALVADDAGDADRAVAATRALEPHEEIRRGAVSREASGARRASGTTLSMFFTRTTSPPARATSPRFVRSAPWPPGRKRSAPDAVAERAAVRAARDRVGRGRLLGEGDLEARAGRALRRAAATSASSSSKALRCSGDTVKWTRQRPEASRTVARGLVEVLLERGAAALRIPVERQEALGRRREAVEVAGEGERVHALEESLLLRSLRPSAPRNANMRLAAPEAGTNFESRPARAASSGEREELRVLALGDPLDAVPTVTARASATGAGGSREERDLPEDLRRGQAPRRDRRAVGGRERFTSRSG